MKFKEWGEFEKRFGIPPTECKFNTEQSAFIVYLAKRSENPEITEEQVMDMDITQEDIKQATSRFFGVKYQLPQEEKAATV